MHAAHVLRSDGWRSREQARRIDAPATVERALQSTPDAIDDRDRALAVVSPGSMLAPRELGRVCALVMVYRRRRASSQHLAQPGARVRVTVLAEKVTAQRSERHGTVHRCELIDADVNRLIWRQTRRVALQRGELITLAGRVQRHTRFGAIPVTVLAYCRCSSQSLPENFCWRLRGMATSMRYL